jgi:hypothetical protein
MSSPESFYAWITPVPTPGIIAAAFLTRHTLTPLVSRNHQVALKMAPYAQAHAHKTEEPVELIRYDRAEVLTRLEPNG